MTRNELFFRVAIGVFAILILYGVGMMTVVLFGDEKLAGKMLNAFGTMFGGVIGFASGFLLGQRNGNGNGATATTKEGPQ